MATKQAGLLLISGPTGSGKTTTTYALIDYLKQELGKSIVTIEDPVEYQQPDIIQMQVNETMGMTYDVGIKEILRHDPDVIIIGEIRDSQTARQALRAAFTGHLVISTVHAKNVLGTINRLLDLGITLQELEQGVIGVANQRLIKFDFLRRVNTMPHNRSDCGRSRDRRCGRCRGLFLLVITTVKKPLRLRSAVPRPRLPAW